MPPYPDPGTTNKPFWTPQTQALTAEQLEAAALRLRCHALIRQVPASGLDVLVASMVEIWQFYSAEENTL